MTKETESKSQGYITKETFVAHIAEASGLTKKESTQALEAMMQSMQGSLKEGKKVSLTGFGAFSTVERSERKGRNPRTGQEITIPAKKQLKFQAGSTLKDEIN